jgi:ferredoxin
MPSHDSAAWTQSIETLLPSIHEVDRNATRIWFRFYPLPLANAFARTDNPEKLAQSLRLDGQHRLADQCDTSHWFFYGHRFWPHVKAAVIKCAKAPGQSGESGGLDLPAAILAVAKDAAAAARADESLVIGIAAAGMMTLQQIGLDAFRRTPGTVEPASGLARKSPDQILAARRKDDHQGLMGLIRGAANAQYSATFDERRADARFTVIRQTPLTNGSARDTRPYPSRPRRCHEGPIPVECRTASCGTCWIGVLAGAEKLSDVEEQEAKLLKDCGYFTKIEARPVIRLACKALPSGNVTIVIPTWNGFLAKGGLQGL